MKSKNLLMGILAAMVLLLTGAMVPKPVSAEGPLDFTLDAPEGVTVVEFGARPAGIEYAVLGVSAQDEGGELVITAEGAGECRIALRSGSSGLCSYDGEIVLTEGQEITLTLDDGRGLVYHNTLVRSR